MVSAAKMCEGYMWRSFRKHNQKAYKLHMECHTNLNFKFIEISSTPWHGPVDQDWRRSKSCVAKCASQPPDGPCWPSRACPSGLERVHLSPTY